MYGSVLHLLVHVVMPGSPEANLKAVWIEIQTQYRLQRIEQRHRYSTLKLTMFGVRGGAKLKGPAGLIRYFGYVLHPLWKQKMNPALDMHKRIELALRKGNEMEKILDAHPDVYALPGSSFFSLTGGCL